MSIEDIVRLRDVTETAMSADGNAVAFVVRDAQLDTNRYRWTLYVIDGDMRAPRVLLQHDGASIAHVRWVPSKDALSFLTSVGGVSQVWETTLTDRSSAKPILNHPTGITAFEWSDDGRYLAFLTSASDRKARAQLEEEGIVYDATYRGDDAFEELIDRRWHATRDEVWIYDQALERARRVWDAAWTISSIHWSPTAEHLAAVYRRDDPNSEAQGGADRNILIQSINGTTIRHIEWRGNDATPAWVDEGRTLLFLSDGATPPMRTLGSRPRLHALDVATGAIRLVGNPNAWRFNDLVAHDPSRDRLLVEHEDGSLRTLYGFDLARGTLTRLIDDKDYLSGCSFNRSRTRAACIRENPVAPPDVAIVDLRSGSVSTLTSLNPNVSQLKLGSVSELAWETARGHRVNGFLVKPTDYEVGRRYPTIVVLYDFSYKFTSHAQWITSYPIQTLAADGFAILLMNLPEHHPFKRNDGDEGLIALVYDPLDAIEKGVQKVIGLGIADARHVGIAGWSRGCFLTAVAVTQSSLFSAASCGEGFIFSPSRYWLTMGRFQSYMEDYFGGPPYGAGLDRYAKVSPPLLADRVRTPVMFEYVAKNIAGLEFYTALRRHGVPTEYVIYPDESHSFSQPSHRLASMKRNRDWFRRWLLGKPTDR